MKIEKRVEKVNRIRKKGYAPGEIYGKDLQSTPIQAEARELLQYYKTYRQNKIFKVKLGRKSYDVYFKEVQNIITKLDDIIHFSLLKVSAGDTIVAEVPIKLVGKHVIESQGMIAQQIMHALELEYPASATVDFLEADVSNLKLGEALYVKDINLPENATTKIDGEEMVANIIYPKVREAKESEAEQSAATSTQENEEKEE
mgnify:FL=1